jgi:hypothetical protein
LTGDPYFTAGLRVVMQFDHRPHSYGDIETFEWEVPISARSEKVLSPQ